MIAAAPAATIAGMLDPDGATVAWLRREILPLLAERLKPSRVVVFDPPDRPAAAGDHPPGVLVVAAVFRGMPVAERNALLHALLAAASPVRPLCLTPEEFRVMEQVPGPVLAAARTGVTLV
jgi:hypothetical protein